MNPFISHPNLKQRKYIAKNINSFIEAKLNRTRQIHSPQELELLRRYNFDGYVVGSDQVWRSLYSPDITSYFLAFVPDQANVKRIAYAASFGVGDWEMTPKETKLCSELAKKFDAVSVRENTAIDLCQRYLSIDAMQVLDPTLLLSHEDYLEIVAEKNQGTEFPKGLFVYILDDSQDKRRIVDRVSLFLKLPVLRGLPEFKFSEVGAKRIDECVIPPVESWLQGFINAKYIITDSFHGCVFSIIFNKPFLAIGNKSRGMTRFESLLSLFCLNERLIHSSDEICSQLIESKIDFENVNLIWNQELKKSFSFLSAAFKDNYNS